MTNAHPDTKLTLRKAYAAHYDRSDLAEATQAWHRYALKAWEKWTANPPIGEVTNLTAEQFKKAALECVKPRTVNTYWNILRSMLRRLGPQVTGCPQGLGIIERVPYLKPCKVVRKRPKRIPLEDLSKFYLACTKAETPKTIGYPPAYWWQGLIVIAYCTGLRKGDLFAIKLEHINLEEGTLWFQAQKTSKEDVFPLHPVAIEHIKRMWYPREYLFPGREKFANGGDFSSRWRDIREQAEVDHFTLHDIRRTSASEIDRVERGLGHWFLQHAPRNVSEVSYISAMDEVGEAIHKMRLPLAFKHGVGMAARAEKKTRDIKMRPRNFAVPAKPDPADFSFEAGGFFYRDVWHKLDGAPWRCLKLLALSADAVELKQLADEVFKDYPTPPADAHYRRQRVSSLISGLRNLLRRILYLDDGWNPIPCIRGNGGKYTLFFPPLDEEKGTAA